MKCVGIGLCVMLGVANLAVGDIITSWTADSSGAYLYDTFNSLLNPEGLRIELVIDPNGDTDFSLFMNGYIGLTGDAGGWDDFIASGSADDVIVASASWLDAGGSLGYFNQVDSTVDNQYAGNTFYFRWFNADSQANATESGIIYGESGWTIGGVPPALTEPAVQLDYTVAESTGSEYLAGGGMDGWQTIAPIPEPGTIGLFLIGAGVLAYRKRRSA